MAVFLIGLAIVIIVMIAMLLRYKREVVIWIRALPLSTWDYLSDRFGAAGDWVLGIALSAMALNKFLPNVENLAQPYIAYLLIITMLLWIGGWYVKP